MERMDFDCNTPEEDVEKSHEASTLFLDDLLTSGDSIVLNQTQSKLERDLESFKESRKELISDLRKSLPSALVQNGPYLSLEAIRVKDVFNRLTQSLHERSRELDCFLQELEWHLISRRFSLDSKELQIDDSIVRIEDLNSKTEEEITQFAVEKLVNNKRGILKLVNAYIKDSGLEQTRVRIAEAVDPNSTVSENFSFPELSRATPSASSLTGLRRTASSQSMELGQMQSCDHPLAAGVNRDAESLVEREQWTEKLTSVQTIFKSAPAMLYDHLTKPKILNYATSYLQQSSKPLRKHQIDFIRLCEEGGNFVFCAKTLQQKTKTLLSYARFCLDRSQIKRLVIVEPTGTLVLKQAAVSILEGLPDAGYRIESCFDISPINDFKNVQIIITTPYLLINNISYQNVDFDSIDLLLLDEFHYCRGDRAYLLVMELCRRTGFSNGRCQVLGFTHITAMGSSVDPTVLGMELPLLQIFAKYVTVAEEGDGIHVREPPPRDEVLFNGLREDNLDKYHLTTQS